MAPSRTSWNSPSRGAPGTSRRDSCTPWAMRRATPISTSQVGSPVASGVYYIKLQIEKRYITKRFILLK